MSWNPDDYEIAAELCCHADIDALPPEKIAAAIRARSTILSAVSGSAYVMDKVYARAAELLDVMAAMAKERCGK